MDTTTNLPIPPPLPAKIHDMTGKVVLITGIGSVHPGWGNGLTTTYLFARQGATIFGCDISLTSAQTTLQLINHHFPSTQMSISQTDVTNSSAVRDLVSQCLKTYGRIDILINIVGKSEAGDPVSMSEEMWDEQMDVNLKSVFLCTGEVTRYWEGQGRGAEGEGERAVVNVGSVSGLRYVGKPQVAYSTAKAALLSFTRTTAVIYADKGIRINCVIPGLINTPLVKVLADKYHGGDYEEYCKIRDAQVPMGRMGTSWDVANAILFLASREAGYITGTEVIVDGGFVQSTGRA